MAEFIKWYKLKRLLWAGATFFHGKGTYSAKVVLILWPEIPQMSHKISAQFVCPLSPKVSNFFKKKPSLGVRSPWSRLKNSMEYISKCDQNWMRRGEKKSILYGTSAACRMIPFPARKTKVIPIYHSGKSIEKKLFFSIVLDNIFVPGFSKHMKTSDAYLP